MAKESLQHNSWHAFVIEDKTFSDIQKIATDDGIDHIAVSKCSIKDAFQKINTIKDKVFFLEYKPGQDHLYQLFIQRAHHSEIKVVLLAEKQNMPDFNWLKQINIDLCETLPIKSKTLKKAFLQLLTKKQQTSNLSAQIITFLKLKPHSGCSTCALNSAAILAENHKVLIIDFDLYFSPIRKHFDLSLNNFLYELLENPERIDKELIKASQINITKNLTLLTATSDLEKNLNPAPEAVDFLLANAAKMFDYIVINLPFNASMYNHASLSLSDKVIGVITADRASLESFMRFEPLVLQNVRSDKFHLWLNHPNKNSDLDDDDFITDLVFPVSGKIGFYPDLMLDAKDEFSSCLDINPHAKFILEIKNALKQAEIYNDFKKPSLPELLIQQVKSLLSGS